MHLTNTYLSKDCTRKCLVYVDKNGHYTVKNYILWESLGWLPSALKARKYKKIESLQRAVNKWIK